MSVLSNDSVTTTSLEIIKEHKIQALTSLINISENNFEDEDGLQEKERTSLFLLVYSIKFDLFDGISQFQLTESAHIEKRVFLLFRYLRI